MKRTNAGPAAEGAGGDADVIGQVIGGEFGRIAVRQKAGVELEIGDILVMDDSSNNNGGPGSRMILSVSDLYYSSQIDDKTHEMISGMALEERPEAASFYEPDLVNYVIASVKPLVEMTGGPATATATSPAARAPSTPKSMPRFHGTLRPVSRDDLRFLEDAANPEDGGLFVGSIRSGSEVIEDAKVWLPIERVLTHHVLIPATTGRGKSNLVKSMLWHMMNAGPRAGMLVLDAHDEYYGRTGPGLRNHPGAADNLAYYTTEPGALPGARTLAINLKSIEPHHLDGIVEFSDAQLGAIYGYYSRHGRDWIARIMRSGNGDENNYNDHDAESTVPDPGEKRKRDSGRDGPAKNTLSVVRRKLGMLLGLRTGTDGAIYSESGIFDAGTRGMTTADDVVRHVESGRIAILDASHLGSEAELVVGNVVATRLLERYKHYKTTGELARKPVASIVIEEAPRVIGSDALKSKSDNIYATIAREGRKFKVGLVAITQLASVIPRTILANMTTKIILGNEMGQEREALIASASQDLSKDDKNIASLDRGEAIITSIFVPFAIPVKIPDFDDVVADNGGRDGGARRPGRMRVFGQ